MKTIKKQHEQGSMMISFLIMMLIISSSVAAVSLYVSQISHLTQRSTSMVSAQQFAEGGAVIAVSDLNLAMTNTSIASLGTKLMSNSVGHYTLNANLGAPSSNVYVRTITSGAPFSNQPVAVQIWMTNVSLPSTAQIVSSATVGPVTETSIVNVQMTWGYGAAILSVNDGTSETSASKSVAQDGNVSINGGGKGPLAVWGGTNGLAALANGRVNVSSTNSSVVDIPTNSLSMTNYSAGTAIPDYTSQGTSNTLFDIGRFVAVANATPSGYAPSGNNHFTNLTTFAAAAALHPPSNPMQGVIVVDVASGDPDMNGFNTSKLPNGINVEGSLVFNFIGSGWNPTTSKIIIDTPVNVNPADLSGLVATNPATYTSGYPPTYTDPTKNPDNINIAAAGYQNFTANDDLPALVYSIGVVDLHNSLNISGVMYTPSYMEIENKHNGDTQYLMGQVIMGNGIYLENNSSATTIVAFDPNAVKNLATANNAGKTFLVTYWQQ